MAIAGWRDPRDILNVAVRRQLPVASPIPVGALPRALAAAIGWRRMAATPDSREAVAAALAGQFGASAVALTDSGTSALVLALRLAMPALGTVALPAYGCPDLLAAAVRARARVRFYDLDPVTLAPDLDSVRGVMARGVQAIVVAHWYGYPADVLAVATMAADVGAVVIEDAAQHAEGRLAGAPLGGTGPLTVLSFGRGKGTTAGGGGALLTVGPQWSAEVRRWEAERAPGAPQGWGSVSRATAQWLLGRPRLYAIPAAVPGLHLGETRYRAAREPAPMPVAAVALLGEAQRVSRAAWAARVGVAKLLELRVDRASGLAAIRVPPNAEPGYLRFAVRDSLGRQPLPSAGIVKGYPRPIPDETAAREVVQSGEPAMPGARELSQTLFTLPTHAWVSDRDLEAAARWASRGAPGEKAGGGGGGGGGGSKPEVAAPSGAGSAAA